ncbi:MAG: selenide, water dikinase SelD [Chromatiales bacterium]
MSSPVPPGAKELVLLGGGHSHLEVLRRFAMRPVPGLRITVVSRDVHTAYSGMLPGHLAGHYSYDESHIDLWRLARAADVALVHAPADGLDLANNRVLCRARPPIDFDILSINIGSRPHTASIQGAAENAIAVKPVDGLLSRWDEIVSKVDAFRDRLRIAVVGGGAGGVELALSVQHRVQQQLLRNGRARDGAEIHLVTDTAQILPSHNPRVRRKLARILRERSIKVYLNCKVREVRPGLLAAEDGFTLSADVIFWATSAAAHPWLRESGLATDADGFVLVNDYLQSISHPQVFAAGDVAGSPTHPRPKSGVFAVRQGPPLAENLRRAALGKPFIEFKPQRQFLSLISTGDKYAVASRSFWSLEGRWVWRWKDWIDRRFMAMYNDMPAAMPRVQAGMLAVDMHGNTRAGAAMRCAGCGAKVASSVLSQALAQLKPIAREDVELGLQAMEDAAVVKAPADQRLVWSVDYFRTLLSDEFLFGKIVANHCLGDLYAMGADPLAALAVATVPYAHPRRVQLQLEQLLAGAVEVLNTANASLAGGHTSEGSELAFGLTVLGLADPQQLLRKAIVHPDAALILTKPIGTGTLFAADMHGKAKGRWIAAAVESMLVSNLAAAKCLRAHGATACTDVTGFGLLGHLAEMLRTGQVRVTLDLDAIPVLAGAQSTINDGIESSLQPENLRARRFIDNAEAASAHPTFSLLFDPQTAGGLLACVPAAKADACAHAMRKLGYPQASIIGHTLPAMEGCRPVRLNLAATR